MKNFIIALIVIILPIATFYILEKTKTTNTEAIAQTTSLPTIIKFASPMCLDCKKLETTLTEIMPEYKDKFNYQKIDVQSKDAITTTMIKNYNVNLVPTIVLLKKDGTIYKQVEGYFTQQELKSMFDALLKQ